MKIATGSTLIHNAQLIPGSGAPAISDAVLLIENGRIAFAGPAAEAPVPSTMATEAKPKATARRCMEIP